MKVAQGVRDGSVTLAFRGWRRQDVKPGTEFKTSAGVVRVTSVEVVDASAISDAEAVLAGWPNAERLLRKLTAGPGIETYRVGLSWAGEDPRIALRETADLSAEDVAMIDVRLERLDRASSHGVWTMQTLGLIDARPLVRAPDLAASVGRETAPFKVDVRKLKSLGLTISHPVGYEISPRGRAYLDRTTRSTTRAG